MNCFTVLIKIKDFFPKFEKIPFDNYLCIFTNNEFEGRISLMQYEYQYIKHEIMDINSDIKYKITVTDCNSKKLIGICDYCISYDKINNLNIGTSINFINHLKLFLSQKTKNDLFGNYYNWNSNDIYLTISTEIIKFNKISNNVCKINNLKLENKNNKKNIYICDINKVSKNKKKTNIKQLINKNARKNPFEYIKIKKINTNTNKNDNIKGANINNINNINNTNNTNNTNIINRTSNNSKKNNNKLEMIYKGEYASPIIFTENDKKNINLNMHNICVQNYYTITSATSPVSVNTIVKKDDINDKYLDKNKIYTKKNFNNKFNKKAIVTTKINNDVNKLYDFRNNFNRLNTGIKRNITNFNANLKNDIKINSSNTNNNNFYQSNINRNEIIKKYNKKNKTKDKEKLSEYFKTKYRDNEALINRVKSNESLTNIHHCFNIDKRNAKKYNATNICCIKNYASVDKVKNKKVRYNKIVKMSNLFRSSTIDFPKKNPNLIKKTKKPYTTNLYNYLNSIENLNYNMTSTSFLNKNNYKKRYNFDKFDNFISPKSYTLRDNSNNNINKRVYNSINNNFKAKLKYTNSGEIINTLSIDEKKNNSISNLNLKIQNNFITNIFKKNNIEKEYRNKMTNFLEYYQLLSKKLKKLINVYKYQKTKCILYKEKYINSIQKKDIIYQKMNINNIHNYIHVKINCRINNQIIPKIKKIKEKEINIYENIFNDFINDSDVFSLLKEDLIERENENKKLYILLVIIKNLINTYGNITQIYNDDIQKKRELFFLLINNGIEINNIDYFCPKVIHINKRDEINNKYNFKEIKEEIEEEEEEDNEGDDEQKEEKINISIVYKNDNIIDKILIEDFPIKYKNITEKKFVKLGSNEYMFNNEIKLFAYYKDEEVYLQIENDNSYDSYKEYSLDEFISKYVKNKNNLNKKKKCYSPIRIKKNSYYFCEKDKKYKNNTLINILERNNNKKKKFKKNNICREKYSRNHKKINEIEYNQEDFKKKFLNGKILFTNDSFINDSNSNSNNIKDSNNNENFSSIEKYKDNNENNSDNNLTCDNNNNKINNNNNELNININNNDIKENDNANANENIINKDDKENNNLKDEEKE